MTVYRANGGSIEESWNALLQQVNDLADECGLERLDMVQSGHRWSRADIITVQNKLTAICADNQFSAVPATWRRQMITEFLAAVERGSCCNDDPILVGACDQCKSYEVEFAYLKNTLGVLESTHGTRFWREVDLFDRTGEVDYTAQLAGLSEDPHTRRFWMITRFFDTGVWEDTEIGVITRCGGFKPAHVKINAVGEHVAATGEVSGRAVYHLLSCCQALAVRASCDDPPPDDAKPPRDTEGNDVEDVEETDEGIPLVICVRYNNFGEATVSGGTAARTIRQPRWASFEAIRDTDDCGRCPDDPRYGEPCDE